MQSKFDAFISYSHHDRDWVRNWLLPRLEGAGIKVCIDFRDFDIGAPILDNMDEAVARSDKTVLVLTPNWVKSEWAAFEALLAQSSDPAAVHRRILSLMLVECELPRRLRNLTWADFRGPKTWDSEITRVLAAFGKTDDGGRTTNDERGKTDGTRMEPEPSRSRQEPTAGITTDGQSGGIDITGGQVKADEIVGRDQYTFYGNVNIYQGPTATPAFQPSMPEENRRVETSADKKATTGARRLRIFISHPGGDETATGQLYQKLLDDGFEPWLDSENILPGQQHAREIPRAVRASDIVLVCLTQKAVTTAGHLHKEIKLVLDVADEQPEGAIFVIPVKLEPCELPDRLSHLSPVNLYEQDGMTRLMRALHTRGEQRRS